MNDKQIYLLTEKEGRYYSRVNNIIVKVLSRPEYIGIGDDGKQRFVIFDASLAAIRAELERNKVSIPALAKKTSRKMMEHYFTIGYPADRDNDTLRLLTDTSPVRGTDIPTDNPIYNFDNPLREETEDEADYWRARRADLGLPDDCYYLNANAWIVMRRLHSISSMLNGDATISDTEISSPFAQMVQTRVTNSLALIATAQEAQKQRSFDGTITVKLANDLTVIIAGTDGNTANVTTTALMLFDAILLTYTAQRNPNRVSLPLSEYAKMRGVTDMKSLRKQVTRDLLFWSDFKYNTVEIVDGKKTPSGNIKICGGTAVIRQGNITFNFNSDFSDALEVLAPMDYAKETLALDPKTSQYYLSRFIDGYYRINEGQKQVERVAVQTLLDKCPTIPTYEEVAASNRDHRGRIIKKLMEDLDAIDRISYDIEDKAGNVIADPESMPILDFLKSYVRFTYWDYPTHDERIQQKQRRAEKKKAEKEKKRGLPVSKDADADK